MFRDLICEFRSFRALTFRGVRIFLRNRAGVFFSLLSPLIVFLLYVLFLGDIQISSVRSALEGIPYDEDVLKAFVDGWMIAGVVSVSCITVSFSAQSVMIEDREHGALFDLLVSPVRRPTVTAAYFACNLAVTCAVVLVMYCVCLIYLAFVGWCLSVADVFSAIGMIVLSALSACMLSTLICGFIRSSSVHSAVTGILSAAIGFLMGAYMPVSVFPTAVQYIVLFVPGTYSAGVFRNIFCGEALKKLCEGAPVAAEEAIREAFSMDMDFFGTQIGGKEMLWIFAITIAVVLVSFVVAILIARLRRHGQR